MMANANNSTNSISSFKGSAAKLILVIVAVLALAAFYFNFSSGQSAEDVSNAELKAIRVGDVQAAYNMTSTSFKHQTSLDAFTTFLGRYPDVRQYASVSFTDKYVGTKTPTAAMSGVLVGSGGRKMQVQILLVKEGKAWRIQGLGLKPSTSDAVILGILVSDVVDNKGSVTKAKDTVDKLSAKIYVTAQIYAPNASGQIEATLTALTSSQKFGPTLDNITQAGNLLKDFVFTKTTSAWAAGEYEVMIKLSSGYTKSIKFTVK
jgi:hypothetical protein